MSAPLRIGGAIEVKCWVEGGKALLKPQRTPFFMATSSYPQKGSQVGQRFNGGRHIASCLAMIGILVVVLGCEPSTPIGQKEDDTDPDERTQLKAEYVDASLFDSTAAAHDLTVEARLEGGYATVQLAWSGSWRNASNWDAAWIFMKARRGNGDWQPLLVKEMEPDVASVSKGPAPTIDIANDGVGAWMYRSEEGAPGENNWTIRLPVQTDAITGRGPLNIKAYGLELVYIPEGAFYVGDGVSRSRLEEKGEETPAKISKEGVVVGVTSKGGYRSEKYTDGVLGASGVYVDGDDGIQPQGASPEGLNADFPTGYHAFYAMKYELTQGEYVDFLNSIPETHRPDRTLYLDFRNAINEGVYDLKYFYEQGGTIREVDDVFEAEWPSRACNFLSWQDIRAYLDWSGLRPMTELEFEKAARGSRKAIPGEYAWGTNSYTAATWVNDDTTAVARRANGNVLVKTLYHLGRPDRRGPARAGLFGENTDGRRDSTGASFYGLMEMSGNVSEHVVTLSKAGGRAFRGTHGDGVLDTQDGSGTNADWPQREGDGVMMRGGDWALTDLLLRISDRRFNPVDFNTRGYTDGVRGARTAPQ